MLASFTVSKGACKSNNLKNRLVRRKNMNKEIYLRPIVEVLLFQDDIVTASNTFGSGDDIGEDIFD